MFLMFVMTACMYNILSGKQMHAMAYNIELSIRLDLQQIKRERHRQQEKRIAETLGYGQPAKITRSRSSGGDQEEIVSEPEGKPRRGDNSPDVENGGEDLDDDVDADDRALNADNHDN